MYGNVVCWRMWIRLAAVLASCALHSALGSHLDHSDGSRTGGRSDREAGQFGDNNNARYPTRGSGGSFGGHDRSGWQPSGGSGWQSGGSGGTVDERFLTTTCLCANGLCDCAEKKPGAGFCDRPCRMKTVGSDIGCCPPKDTADGEKKKYITYEYAYIAIPFVLLLLGFVICGWLGKREGKRRERAAMEALAAEAALNSVNDSERVFTTPTDASENSEKGDNVYSITGPDVPTTSAGLPPSLLPPPPYEPTHGQEGGQKGETTGNDDKEDLPPPYAEDM